MFHNSFVIIKKGRLLALDVKKLHWTSDNGPNSTRPTRRIIKCRKFL